jgi:hypothetical protein
VPAVRVPVNPKLSLTRTVGAEDATETSTMANSKEDAIFDVVFIVCIYGDF